MSRRTVLRSRIKPMGSHAASTEGIVATLDTKVGILENDIGDVSTRVENLDAKFDKVMGAFASEFRTAIAALSTQLSERNKTPWGILISGAGVVLTVVALVGHQALSPIVDGINQLNSEMVPRKEFEARYNTLDRSDRSIRDEVRELENREHQRLLDLIDSLRKENSILRYKETRPADH